MSRAELIYPFRRRLEKELQKIGGDPNNGKILTRYYRVRSGQVSLATIFNEMNRLRIMSKLLGRPFAEVKLEDMEDLVFKIDNRCKSNGTSNKYRKILKKFYQWLKRYPEREYPAIVKWIRLKKVPFVAVTEKDLISFEECIKITEAAANLRDKALFQCKLDAGCRIGEILTSMVGEVEFNDGGAIIYSDGKTGRAPLILTWSATILSQWLNHHPFRNDPSSPLWPLLDREKPTQMSYAAAYQMFRKCVKKSGISKRVWPHLFKHVSSSYDSEIGMSDTYRKYKHHWTPDSKMAKVYEHLSSRIVKRIQKESWTKAGVEKDIADEEKKIQLLKTCRRCNYENPRDSLYCNRCAFPLEQKKASEIVILKSKTVELLNKLEENPQKLNEVLEILKNK